MLTIKNNVLERLKDAEALLNAGRREGGMFYVLIAMLATARKRFPGEPDGDRFMRFFDGEWQRFVPPWPNGQFGAPTIRQMWHDGELRTLAEILWGLARSGLAHEGGFDPGLEVFEDPRWRMSFPGGGRLRVSEGFVRRLVGVLARVPENADELRGYEMWIWRSAPNVVLGHVVYGEDWISGRLDVLVGTEINREPDVFRIVPNADSQPDSIIVNYTDGTSRTLPNEPVLEPSSILPLRRPSDPEAPLRSSEVPASSGPPGHGA